MKSNVCFNDFNPPFPKKTTTKTMKTSTEQQTKHVWCFQQFLMQGSLGTSFFPSTAPNCPRNSTDNNNLLKAKLRLVGLQKNW